MSTFWLFCLQVYYHLGAFEESLTYALGAGKLFDVNSSTEYVGTTICKFSKLQNLILSKYF